MVILYVISKHDIVCSVCKCHLHYCRRLSFVFSKCHRNKRLISCTNILLISTSARQECKMRNGGRAFLPRLFFNNTVSESQSWFWSVASKSNVLQHKRLKHDAALSQTVLLFLPLNHDYLTANSINTLLTHMLNGSLQLKL